MWNENGTKMSVNLFRILVVGAVILGDVVARRAPPRPLTKGLHPPTRPKSPVDRYANQKRPVCTSMTRRHSSKNGIIPTKYRWKTFNVYIQDNFNKDERQAINNGMYTLQQVLPCVKFGLYAPGAKPTGDYMHIQDGDGCSSVIGRQGRGKQIITLKRDGCMSKGTIMHEMIHALGFDHEQSRPDRDKYVTIHPENIREGEYYLRAFERLSSKEYSTFGVPYDKHSIMHYHGDAFSKNKKPTITAKDGGKVGRLNDDLRESDKKKLKAMYKC